MSLKSSTDDDPIVAEAAGNISAAGTAAIDPAERKVPPPPTWFQSKAGQSGKVTRKPIDFQDIKSYIDRSDRRILYIMLGMLMHPLNYLPQLSGMFVSVTVHAIFLCTLAILTYTTGTFQRGELSLYNGEGGEDLAMTKIDTSVAMDASTAQLSEASISMPVPESSKAAEGDFDNQALQNIEASVFDSVESEMNPFKGAFAPPAGTKVVKRGSFAAYTVPNDPVPEQNYYVVILIKVPDGLEQYPVSDLSGSIVGTDGWDQPIVDKSFLQRNKYLEVKDHVAQLVVQVPGAYKLVKDKISIKSKLLKENQRLEIEF